MRQPKPYRDRNDAGRQLASDVAALDLEDPVVLALPRGGVPVAVEVATRLDAPLDVLLVRKIGAPGQPELGVGAVGEDDVVVVDRRRIAGLGIDLDHVDAVAAYERRELERRAELYRSGRPMMPVEARDAVIVDDGIATGGTAEAAVEVVRRRGARHVVVAAPVAASTGLARLTVVADAVVCPLSLSGAFAVGTWYRDFHQLDDDEVARLLAAGRS